MSILNVTCGPAALDQPLGQSDRRYGGGTHFQVGPATAAVCCSLRVEGMPVGDFEDGSDVFVFDTLEDLAIATAVPVSRNEKITDPASGRPRIIIKYPIVGGFVPFGAKRSDGTLHPHAGTGFGIGQALDFPMLEGGYYAKEHKDTEMVRLTDVTQFAFDGAEFQVAECERHGAGNLLEASDSGWFLISPGLRPGIADGDDLLCTAFATRSDSTEYLPLPAASGVARWRRQSGRWQPVDFIPVAHTGNAIDEKDKRPPTWAEPSLICDTDGSLLFTARGAYGDLDHVIRIWRSTDNGENWEVVINRERARGQAPITINQAADGTPYVVANRLGYERDWLALWPLSDDRKSLKDPIDVRNATAEFGPPPSGMVWFMDHASGETVRLADGRWHHLLSYRIMDRGEHGGGAPPPQTGLYLEEVASAGEPLAGWRFG